MIGCIIQARMNSMFYGKILKKLDKKNPVIYYVIKQMQECKLVDDIVIATTDLDIDKEIVNYAKKMNIKYFTGSPVDVLDRLYHCAKKYSFSTIVKIGADEPLNDPKIIDKEIKKMIKGNFDCVTTSLLQTFPKGIGVEILSFNALEKSWRNSSIQYEREHVTPYIYNNSDKFKIFNLVNSKNISNINLIIQRENDLKLIKNVIKKIKKRPILMEDVIKLLDKEPESLKMNKTHNFKRSFLK